MPLLSTGKNMWLPAVLTAATAAEAATLFFRLTTIFQLLPISVIKGNTRRKTAKTAEAAVVTVKKLPTL